MKLDVNVLRYLSKDDFRVLTAVEMGQKNHEIVPMPLIDSISGLKHGGAYKCIKVLLRHKLVHKDCSTYEGYRLTYQGYDFLAIKALVNRGLIASVGRQIGVGKESDIFEVSNDEGEVFALKLHRLGRTSFRAVKNQRDYLGKRQNYSWLYLSRLAALKEFAFMKALGEHGFPVPQALDNNRHAVLMSLVHAHPLVQVKKLTNEAQVYLTCMELISRLAGKGLIHCDFNEFNLLISDDEEITLIDFPQMVSVSHANARELFERDVECIIRFFSKKIGYMPEHDPALPYVRPKFDDVVADNDALDVDLAASGFQRQHQKVLDDFITNDQQDTSKGDDNDDDDDNDKDGANDGDADADAHKSGGAAFSGRQSNQAPAGDVSAALMRDGSSAADAAQQGMSGHDTVAKEVDGMGEAALHRDGLSGEGCSTAEQDDEDDDEAGSRSSKGPDGSQEGEDASAAEWHKAQAMHVKKAHVVLGEREVQQALAQQRKKAIKREVMMRATARRNVSKESNKGGKRSRGGGSASAPSFGGW